MNNICPEGKHIFSRKNCCRKCGEYICGDNNKDTLCMRTKGHSGPHMNNHGKIPVVWSNQNDRS